MVRIIWSNILDSGTGFQGEFDAVESDGPGPLRCKYAPNQCSLEGPSGLFLPSSGRGLDSVHIKHQ
jgi:hypothetical protein